MTATMHAPATATSSTLVAPHGGTLVNRMVFGEEAAALSARAQDLPRVQLTDTQAADLEMIANGAMSPLTGFVSSADYTSIVANCRLANGAVWSLPITLHVDSPMDLG